MRTPLLTRAILLGALGTGIVAGCKEDEMVVPPPAAPVAKADIILTIITTGGNPDRNGYSLDLDEKPVGQLSFSTERILTVDPGIHLLLLADLADNCAVVGENPKSVTVTPGGRAAVTFQVDCPLLGAIDITTATTGSGMDPDGYLLTIDGAVRDTLGLQDAATIGSVRPGLYQVRLASVAVNCDVTDGSTRMVVVGDGQIVSVPFVVTCDPRPDDTPGEKLVVASRIAPGQASSLFIMQTDGTSRQRLTDDAGDAMSPEFSPDGDKILFLQGVGSTRSLIVLDRASRKETTLPTSNVDRAVWSPDGTRILFARNGRLSLMRADGSGETALTTGTDDRDPNWSPDGSQIAFTRGLAVYVIRVDGRGMHQVGTGMHAAGPWSPDGRQLLVTQLIDWGYYYYYATTPTPADLAVLDVATGEEKMLTNTPLQVEYSPVWSADGQRVFFIASSLGNPDVFSIRLDGSELTNMTSSYSAIEEWVTGGVVRAPFSASRSGRGHRP